MKKSTEKILAYLFGVIFVTAILIVAIVIDTPTPLQEFVFRVVISLAAAGIAAVIPGFINVDVNGFLRAGGAIAVFVIVYFTNPADISGTPGPGLVPDGDPKIAAEVYLAKSDSLDLDGIWSSYSNAVSDGYNRSDFEEAFKNVRAPLGELVQREFVGMDSRDSVDGMPPAHYRVFTFKSTFSNGQIANETVVVMSDGESWKVAAHNIYAQ